ncbi:MAG: response regulator, partial [Bacteroidales bacterium]|nr:response regulator [Bacteroidales bacterium]
IIRHLENIINIEPEPETKNMKQKNILLVEDNPDDAELTILALRSKGIINSIDHVVDGQEALDYLFCEDKYSERDKTEKPAVILLDLNLPKISGLDVLKTIRADKRTRLLPVVIFTSSKEEKDLINGYNFGANSYIQKPVDADKFNDAINQLKMYWLLLNEPPPDL